MFKLDWDRSIGAKVMEGFVLVVRSPQKKIFGALAAKILI